MQKQHVSDIFMLENLFCLVINEFFYLCNQYTYINIIFRGHGGSQTHLPGFCRSGPQSFRHPAKYLNWELGRIRTLISTGSQPGQFNHYLTNSMLKSM